MFKRFTPKMKNVKTIEFENDMILGVRDRPKFKDWMILAIQHVFSMFGATVLIPLLINGAAHEVVISTDIALFSSGVGTLIYIACTGAKVPIYLGSSAAYVATMGALYPMYGNSMFLGLLGVGVIYCLVALAVYLFGTGWLKKLLPPVVVGPMIMVIGLGLAGIAVTSMGISSIHNVDWWAVGIVVITVISAMVIALVLRGRLKLLPILGAMVIGFAAALIVSTWHKGIINYSSAHWDQVGTYIGAPDFSNSLFAGKVGAAGSAPAYDNHALYAYLAANPTVSLTTANDALANYDANAVFKAGSVGAMLQSFIHIKAAAASHWSVMPFLIMMPIAFATIAEHIGDHTVLGKITGRDYINGAPGVHRTLLGDGLATMFGGLVGSAANTSYGENTTTVGLSKAGSVWVTGTAAIFAVIISFLKFISTILNLIPSCVTGGLELVLFGFIASNGLKVLVDDKVNMHDVRNVFVVSVMLVLGLGGATFGWVMGSSEVAFSGTAIAMAFGIIANAFLPKDRGLDMDRMPKVSTRSYRSNKRVKKAPKGVDEQNMF